MLDHRDILSELKRRTKMALQLSCKCSQLNTTQQYTLTTTPESRNPHQLTPTIVAINNNITFL